MQTNLKIIESHDLFVNLVNNLHKLVDDINFKFMATDNSYFDDRMICESPNNITETSFFNLVN